MTTNEPSQEQEFLKECHAYFSKNFDNTIWIPENIWDKYRRVDRDELWKTHLRWKFRYLYDLEQNPPITRDDFIEQLKKEGPPCTYLIEFVDNWLERQNDERLAYLYRYTQLPPEIVHQHYYNQQIDTCYRWCCLRQKEITDIESERNNSNESWKINVANGYQEISDEPSMDFCRDWSLASSCQHGLRGLTEEIKKIQGCLIGEDSMMSDHHCKDVLNEIQNSITSITSEYSRPLSEYLKDKNADFIARLSLRLVQVLSKYFDEEAIMEDFLKALKDKFNCEVCDYVRVAEGGNLIEWQTATVDLDDLSPKMQKLKTKELDNIIKERESYKKGEGISGSILLQTDDMGWNLMHHIGSNDVLNDPRQSAEHRNAYEEDIYPGVLKVDRTIHNFWMFPIFRDGKLEGAFRVVNKLDSQGKLEVGGWPYFARIELSFIALWFSEFLRAIKGLDLRKEDILYSFALGKVVDEIRENLELKWIDRKFFLAIVRLLRRIMFKKEEKRTLGCSVIITNKNTPHRLVSQLDDYPLIDLGVTPMKNYSYDELDTFIDVVDPLSGSFVFDNEGTLHRIVSLKFKNEAGLLKSGFDVIHAIDSIIEPPSVFILLQRGSRNIVIYKNGKRSAELYLDERTGEWKGRSVELIRETIRNNSEINPDALEIVLETALGASQQKIGALLILGDLSKEKFEFKKTCQISFSSRTSITDVGTPTLLEFAKLDGAIIIDDSGLIKRVCTTINPERPVDTLKIFLDRGARHKAAEKICRVEPEALVLVISENGGISILKDKEGILTNY